jgi:hypothetical protein
MKKTLSSLTLLSSLTVMASANAAPASLSSITWTNNSHTYEIVQTKSALTWDEARAAAIGKGGYLATITSLGEAQFVYDNLVSQAAYWGFDQWGGQRLGPWLGGYQNNPVSGETSPSANWEWVTGEAWTIGFWAANEPNEYKNLSEDFLQYYSKLGGPAATWNDSTNDGLVHGGDRVSAYVVEYGGFKDISAVPVPSAAFLFAPALIGFISVLRKTKKA